jgi:hypothetical protein
MLAMAPPPKGTQFRPGRSGNPAGRRKSVRNLKTDVQRTLKVPLKANASGRPQKISTQEEALLVLREKALKGDARSLDRLLDFATQSDTTCLKANSLITGMECTPKVRHGKMGTVVHRGTHVQVQVSPCFQPRVQARHHPPATGGRECERLGARTQAVAQGSLCLARSLSGGRSAGLARPRPAAAGGKRRDDDSGEHRGQRHIAGGRTPSRMAVTMGVRLYSAASGDLASRLDAAVVAR